MAKALMITAYGSVEDREKLAAIAYANGCSSSEWLIKQIRQQFQEAFGDADPKCIIPQQK